MKKIFRIVSVAAVLTGLFACNKAEYVSANFVSLNADRYNVPEDSGIYAVPVSIYGANECTVTFKTVDGKAKAGVNYEIVDKDGKANKSGVVKVTSDAKTTDYIYVKLVDNPEYTGNLDFTIELVASATEGVNLGSTTSCKFNIIDNQGGLSVLIGSWSGSGAKSNGDGTNKLSFDLDEYDIEADPDEIKEYYPDCNVVISNGNFNDGDMDFAADIYGYFDELTWTLHIYGLQYFNAYNFGSIGVNFVALGNRASGTYYNDITFACQEGKMVLDNDIFIWLVGYDDEKMSGYQYAGGFAAGFTMTKL